MRECGALGRPSLPAGCRESDLGAPWAEVWESAAARRACGLAEKVGLHLILVILSLNLEWNRPEKDAQSKGRGTAEAKFRLGK